MNPLDLRGEMVCGVLLLSVSLLADYALAQRPPATHQIFMSAVELKGSTTTETLAPPAVNPMELSKGYGFKASGEADQGAPERWEVSSYLLTSGFTTVQ
jgi:hypothetical protein